MRAKVTKGGRGRVGSRVKAPGGKFVHERQTNPKKYSMRIKFSYNDILSLAKKHGFEGMEGCGTNKKYFIRLIHPQKSKIITGNSFNVTMTKVKNYLIAEDYRPKEKA